MDPGDGAAADPVLEGSEEPVDVRVLGDGSVIGVMLDVQSCWRDEGWTKLQRKVLTRNVLMRKALL